MYKSCVLRSILYCIGT